MKSLIAVAFIVATIPFFYALAIHPTRRKYGYILVGSLPFVYNAVNLDSALIDWAFWPGYVKGMIITVMDSLAVAIILSNRNNVRGTKFIGLFWFYIASSTVSVLLSDRWLGSFFYVFQLIKVLLVFVAVVKITQDSRSIRWIAVGLAFGAIFQAMVAVDQRLSGAFQVSGTLGHQNLLGMMLHFVTLPLMALLLAGERSKIMLAGLVAALLTVALGASRGSIGFLAIGMVLLLVLSLMRRPTVTKWRATGTVLVICLLVSPLIIGGMEKRFQSLAENGEYNERAKFENAASSMWADHPFGVGANQYVIVANTRGYSERAGVTWGGNSRSANVHHAYLLVAAETGWIGLFGLILLLCWPVIIGIHFAFKYRRDPRGDVILGVSASVITVILHNFYEWVFVTQQVQYLFAISIGITAGLIQKRASPSNAKRRKMRMVGNTKLQ